MNSCSKFLNSSLTPKTRDNIIPAPIIAHIPKKQLQVHAHPAVRLKMMDSTYCASMKGFFQKVEISSKQLILVDVHAKRLVPRTQVYAKRFFFLSSATAAPNDQVESENLHVFISFRGETRTGFTGHLYKELSRAGYRTFIDDLMRRGENIEEELTMTIRNSEVAVIVISPGYASSQSCLDELVRCFGLKVLPVFYLVDPEEVYNLSGNFGLAFDGLIESLEDAADKRVNHWKEALKEVVGISGLVLRQNQYETYFIDQIVKEVKKLLSQAPQRAPSLVVGCHCFVHGFNLWLQSTALSIESHIIIECGGIVATAKYLFVFTFMALMVIRLGITLSLELHFVNRTEKLKNDNH